MAAARRGRAWVVAVVVLTALIVLTAPACGGGETTDAPEPEPTEASARGGHWDIGRAGTGVEVEVDAGAFVLSVAEDGLVRVERGTVIDEGRAYLVRDGARHDVREVVQVKSGLDHVTLDVVFADGSTGRLELGALDDDVIAVRVDVDDDAGVTDRGITLPLEMVDLR